MTEAAVVTTRREPDLLADYIPQQDRQDYTASLHREVDSLHALIQPGHERTNTGIEAVFCRPSHPDIEGEISGKRD